MPASRLDFRILGPLSVRVDGSPVALGGPKQLIIYADARHSIGGVPSASNGPDPRDYQAKWIQARLAGKPLSSEYWFVEPSGRIDKTALA